MLATCSIDECEKPAARGGLCWTHTKRKQRGRAEPTPIRGYAMPMSAKLSRAATRIANAEEDDEFERARALLEKYARGKGARQRLRTVIEEIVRATLEKLFRGQSYVPENVHSQRENSKRG